ncbi:PAS domain-containing protein [Nostoc sp. LEGE 06077]|uniref:hybrid sensor histidine kinase/response regulator n=1 Tax=Nostoc sp. LEGE 06077 TaxID=915325 RepID=UPI00187F93F9|nr:PAS domain-containing protein [Nostoc sp. LEGE 06077]MBE9205276.1 PAS domain-containing protein [Nostoc sp. LEGE 06077]
MPDAEICQNQLAQIRAYLHQQIHRQTNSLSVAGNEEGMVLLLADGSIPACNASSESILGITVEELQKHGWLGFNWYVIHEDGTCCLCETHPAIKVLQTGNPCLDFVCGFSQPNGELVWLLTNSQPLFSGNDTTAYGVVTTFTQIAIAPQPESNWERYQDSPIIRAVESQANSDNLYLIEKIADIVPGVMYIYDLVEQQNFYVNAKITQLWGYTPTEIQAMGNELFSNLMHPEDLLRLPSHVEQFQSADDHDTFTVEYRIKHANGEWRWFCSYETIYRKTIHGLPHQILGIAFDITERRHIEIALRQSNERFELAAAAVNCLIYDWNQRENSIQRTSGLTQLFGYTQQEAEPSLQWWQERIHTDDQQRIIDEFTAAMAVTNRYHIEYRVRHQHGHDVWVDDRGFVVQDEDGQIVRVVGAITDITQRKQAEDELRQRETQLRRLVEANIIGIMFSTPDKITEANDAFLDMLGYSREELLAGKIRREEITPPEYGDRDRQKIRELLTDGVCTPYEKEYIRKDNSRVPILIGGALVEQQPAYWVCFILDLTNTKQLERALRQQTEELKQANQIKDEFLSILSHELRSPLNPILGWATLLKTRKFDETITIKALETIEHNAKLQLKLIDDLLDVSRIIRGKLHLNFVNVDLGYVINAALETVRLAATEKSITIDKGADINLAKVLGDFHRLQQVVVNLLSNAIKFTPAGQTVEITLTTSDNYAKIIIKDSGQGISPDFLPFVFDYFRQADSSITRKFGGLGLGLAIVHHLVDLHSGTVTADSPGENQGATFTVKLPLIQDKKTAFSPIITEDQKLNPTLLTGLKILVVDDEIDTRHFISFLLKQYGAIATVAASATEALLAIAESPPDLIISDLGMPEVDGYTLMQLIKSLPAAQGGNIPAIALTAYVAESDRQKVLAAGFKKHVTKPVDTKELISLIADLMGRRDNDDF